MVTSLQWLLVDNFEILSIYHKLVILPSRKEQKLISYLKKYMGEM